VLAGFSQGCAMTLHTGIRVPFKLAGLMGLSGYLPLGDLAQAEHQSANLDTPIFLAHGTYDPVVAPERAETSRAKLQDLGYKVQWHTYPMPHSVCPEEISDISQFLQSVLV
jgi:phospholipase/carboxylesterase